jgi:rhodanese-related sulfurtransferase
LITLGAAQFGMEQYEDAATTLERAVKRNPDNELPLILLASSYGHLGRNKDADAATEAANDLRARAGLGDLSLEKNQHKWWSPFNGEIDFARFGASSEQKRVRSGLSEISALTWQYLVVVYSTAADGYNARWEVEGTTEIKAATAKSLHDRGVVFVDVSLMQVWDKGHIPGAINLPYSRSDDSAKKFTETALMEIVDEAEDVVIYSGGITATRIAAFASAKAVNWNFQRVYFFSGGLPAWKQEGFPVEIQ